MDKSSTMSCFSCSDKTNEVQTPSDKGETFDQLVWSNFNYVYSKVNSDNSQTKSWEVSL